MQGGQNTMSLDRASVRKYGGKIKSYNNELETYVFISIYFNVVDFKLSYLYKGGFRRVRI